MATHRHRGIRNTTLALATASALLLSPAIERAFLKAFSRADRGKTELMAQTGQKKITYSVTPIPGGNSIVLIPNAPGSLKPSLETSQTSEGSAMISVDETLNMLGLRVFPPDIYEIKIGSPVEGAHLFGFSSGLIYLYDLESRGDAVHYLALILKEGNWGIDNKTNWVDSNRIFAILCDNSDLMVFDRVKGKVTVYGLQKYISKGKTREVILSVDVDEHNDRIVFLARRVEQEIKPICGVAIDRGKVLLAGL